MSPVVRVLYCNVLARRLMGGELICPSKLSVWPGKLLPTHT